MCLLETLTLVTTVFMVRCMLSEDYLGTACLMVLLVIECCMWTVRTRKYLAANFDAEKAKQRLEAEYNAKQQQSDQDYSNDF